MSTNRPKLLLLSHVLPFPGSAGQQQRVRETLMAARDVFHVTFATSAPLSEHTLLGEQLSTLCDDVLLLPSRYHESPAHRAAHHVAGVVYALATGLKSSNYVIGRLEFAPERVNALVNSHHFDVAIFEYWHAAAATSLLQRRGIRCVLDMHDILWQGRAQRLLERKWIPKPVRDWAVARYREREEMAWTAFDGVVAINGDERDYIQAKLPPTSPVFYAPMGTDLAKWSYQWSPASPPRIAYYGALGTAHNRRSAMECYRDIMPDIWRAHPSAELWLVGGHPSEELRALSRDPRVIVTGFVPKVQETLASMTAVLCPWRGTYGFRSRLVEVMSLGVPVVASPDAVAGMGMTSGEGLYLANNAWEFAQHCNELLAAPELAARQSHLARAQMERLFSLDATYNRLMRELRSWIAQPDANGRMPACAS